MPTHHIDLIRLITARAKPEIARIEKLREDARDTNMSKSLRLMMLVAVGAELTDEHKKKNEVMNEYYRSVEAHLTQKIKVWEQIEVRLVDANLMDKLNETMTEWLEATWAYFGMEDVRKDSDGAMEEYKMFKDTVREICEVKKKKTRRAGKKHKKKTIAE
tara:strand:- start:412 stop:891 length:480 start_codon:yes stop_codon:yes gene_type:complete